MYSKFALCCPKLQWGDNHSRKYGRVSPHISTAPRLQGVAELVILNLTVCENIAMTFWHISASFF